MAETPTFDTTRLAGLEKQIESLLSCKPLPESEISKLCDMVSIKLFHLLGLVYQWQLPIAIEISMKECFTEYGPIGFIYYQLVASTAIVTFRHSSGMRILNTLFLLLLRILNDS